MPAALLPEAQPANPAAAVFATPVVNATFQPVVTPSSKVADPAAAPAAPASAPLHPVVAPKNLIAPGVAAVLNGVSSERIAKAFAQHWTKMAHISQEYDHLAHGDKTYHGYDSAKIADAIMQYSKANGGSTPREVKLAISPNALSGEGNEWAVGRNAWSGFGLRAAVTIPANVDGTYTIDGTNFKTAPFSCECRRSFDKNRPSSLNPLTTDAETVQSLYWAQIIYCIVWIVTGLLLVFNGWASYTWLSRAGARERTAILPNGKKVKSRAPILGGGVGGAVVGFLFISWFATLIMCAICARGRAPPNSTAYFAIWLAPALVLGAGVGGHFKIASRAFAGLLAGVSLTLMLTAVFGINTLTIRVILLSIFCSLFTAPLLLMPRSGAATVQRHLLNVCTSLIGMMTFLTGVALFAPPEDSSGSWIDLWALLFAPDNSASQAAAISAWGTPAFKGYIAGAVLGTVIGCVFEYFLHAKAGMDAQEEWNDYLAGYTERFVDKTGDAGVRAGSFEPAPTGWQRFANLFSEADRRPASYGADLPAAATAGGFTELNLARRAKSTRSSRKTSGGPARFKALSRGEKDADLADEYELRHDDDDDDSDATDVESDAGDMEKKAGFEGEAKDSVPELKKGEKGAALENYRGYALPRPPSYRTDSSGSGTGNGSGLSGTTKASSDAGLTTPSEEVHKALGVYRDSSSGTPPAKRSIGTIADRSVSAGSSPTTALASSPVTNAATVGAPQHMVPATPSLINAITRIQQAQAQAKAWQTSQQSRGPDAPYGATPKSPEPGSSSSPIAPAVGSPSSSPAAASSGAVKFDKWWDKEVKGKK